MMKVALVRIISSGGRRCIVEQTKLSHNHRLASKHQKTKYRAEILLFISGNRYLAWNIFALMWNFIFEKVFPFSFANFWTCLFKFFVKKIFPFDVKRNPVKFTGMLPGKLQYEVFCSKFVCISLTLELHKQRWGMSLILKIYSKFVFYCVNLTISVEGGIGAFVGNSKNGRGRKSA